MQGPMLIVQMDVKGLDFDKLLEEFDEQIEDGMDQLAKGIERVWREKATQQLNTSRDKYLEGLSVERIGADLIQTSLTGFVAVSIEDGRERYDMKPGILGNALSKVIPIGKSAGGPVAFRTMHSNSSGWWHPGFQARQIHKQVQDEVDKTLVPEIFGERFSRISI